MDNTSGEEQNLSVSFKLSREAAIKLREIALTNHKVLCNLGVIAVQLGNDSQICISPPMNVENGNNEDDKAALQMKQEQNRQVINSLLSETAVNVESMMKGKRGDEIGRNVDYKRAKMNDNEQMKLTSDNSRRRTQSNSILGRSASIIEGDSAPYANTNHTEVFNTSANVYRRKSGRGRGKKTHATRLKREVFGSKRGRRRVSRTPQTQTKQQFVEESSTTAQANNKYGEQGLSFAQQLINLSKQYRQENANNNNNNTTVLSPNEDTYVCSSPQIVGKDHVLQQCFNEKNGEDFMGLDGHSSLLFHNYDHSSVKTAEELSKEQSEISPVLDSNLETMSVSSPDSLFEEARLENVEDLSLSPVHTSASDSPSESLKSERNSPLKFRKSSKYQRILKGQTGVVCELCVRPVQKSYSCYQISEAPKEIMHLFDENSTRVRVCRRCLPYKAPKGAEKSAAKKPKKTMTDLLK